MMMTRPDLAFPTQYLSRFMSKATNVHLNAAKGSFSYLKGTKNLAICFSTTKSNQQPIITAYSDSDFAGCKETSKSTGGFLTTINSGPISWRSKRASLVVLSTLEAESDALLETIREVQQLSNLCKELEIDILRPIPLYCDNQGSISNSNDPNQHARTKHTLLKFRYIREQAQLGLVKITYLPTNSMPADGLTKPLPGPKFTRFRELLGLRAC